MVKKVLVVFGALVLVLLLVFAYMNYRSRTLSPRGFAELHVDDLHVEISYNRPSVRGRVIFGPEEDGAIQPYGSYWRLGANEATEISVSQDVSFNGMPLQAGTYRLYAIPGADKFRIGVNTELGKWGAWEPDYNEDVFVTDVPVNRLELPVEQFTIRLEKDSDQVALIYFEWSDVQLIIPIAPSPSM